jgi:CHASE3 domain sensor protein
MIKLIAVLQTFTTVLSERLRDKADDPESGLEALQVVIIAAIGLVLVLAVMAAIEGRVQEWIARI